jgi:hypothetical protein
MSKYVRIKNLRELDHNIAPYIDERMYQYIGQSFDVIGDSYSETLGKDYYTLKNVPFYFIQDWLEDLPEVFKYENLVRLDRKWGN